jgi:hypothetical protein
MSVIAAMLLASAQPALAKAGDCGWVHGRFGISNGSSIQRIWMIGTSHMLALYDDDTYYPPSMRRLVDSKSFVPFETDIYGDFRVCARQRRISGHMQHVQLKAAKNLIAVQR